MGGHHPVFRLNYSQYTAGRQDPPPVLGRHQRLPQAGDPLVPLPLVLAAEVPGGVAAGVGDGEPVVLKHKIKLIKLKFIITQRQPGRP